MKGSQKNYKKVSMIWSAIRFRKITLETIGGWVGWEGDWSQGDVMIYLVRYKPMRQWQYKLKVSGDGQDMKLTKLGHLPDIKRGY